MPANKGRATDVSCLDFCKTFDMVVIDGLAGLVKCKTKDKGSEVVKSRRANKRSK